MNKIISLHNSIFDAISKVSGEWLVPTAARHVFAATLFFYFWNSAVSKLGEGIFGFLQPSFNAYIQIFPKRLEAADFDISGFGAIEWLVAVAGTWAEFILPVAIVIGLFTRLAAFGIIGFIFVQSIVDVYGHGVSGPDIGGWFDGHSGSLILDQHLFWVFLMVILIVKGAGFLSVDHVLKSRGQSK